MKTLTSHRITRGLGRLAFAAAASTVLLTGVLSSPAGAVSPPYVSSTAIAAAPAAPVNGQAVTFTATVSSSTAPPLARKPWGTVVFTVKGADATVFTCDAGNTVTIMASPATCTFAAGLAASDSPYSVRALYTDTADTHYQNSGRTISVPVALGPTTTTVASTANPSVSGEPITVTANCGGLRRQRRDAHRYRQVHRAGHRRLRGGRTGRLRGGHLRRAERAPPPRTSPTT